MTHYLRNDTRIRVIRNLMTPFIKQLNDIREICKKDNFKYWDIYEDDTEHLIGTVFIILQNYINSSISDLYPELSIINQKYSVDKLINEDSKTTRIQLIISIANYYKHRDLPKELYKPTTYPFEDLKIEYKAIYNSENNKFYYKIGSGSPIFNGLTLLSEEWDLNDLIEIVSDWRENLWNCEYPRN